MDFQDLYDFFDYDSLSTLLPQPNTFLPLPENAQQELPQPNLTSTNNIQGPPDSQLEPVATDTNPSEPVPKPRQRRYAPRSRVGCLTCRARRKRCDVQQPVCQGCARINAVCQWPKKVRVSDYDRGADNVKNKGPATPDHPNVTSSSNPQVSDVDANVTAAQYATIAEALPSSVPRSPAWYQKSRRQLNPVETSCERHLLSYYIHSFIPRVTIVQSPANFFTSLYVPLAFQYPSVMDAAIACAAAHFAKSVQDPAKTRELNLVAVQRQRMALGFLKEYIDRSKYMESEECKLEVVVTLLLLVGLDIQAGSRGLRWMQQVNCVRKVLQKHHASSAKSWSSYEADCIHRHFLYHDVMSLMMEDVLGPETPLEMSGRNTPFGDNAPTYSTIQAQDPFRPVSMTIHPTISLPYERSVPSVDCLLGFSKDLFSIITRLRDLPECNPYGNGLDEAGFFKIETDLSNWQYDQTLASTLDINTRLDLIALAECHRLAAMILLYRRCPSRSFYLSGLASQIMSIVPRIAPESVAAPALTPILFLAGAELSSQAEIELCAARLNSIKEVVKMMNIASAEEVLRVVWKERLQNNIRTDWLDIMRAKRWTINLG